MCERLKLAPSELASHEIGLGPSRKRQPNSRSAKHPPPRTRYLHQEQDRAIRGQIMREHLCNASGLLGAINHLVLRVGEHGPIWDTATFARAAGVEGILTV